MTVTLRLILLVGAVFTLLYFFYQIRRERMQIHYTVFWVFFSLTLVVIGVFPQIAVWASQQLGFQAPVNFIFLLIIFILILNQFGCTIKLSELEQKIAAITQHIALTEKQINEFVDNDNTSNK